LEKLSRKLQTQWRQEIRFNVNAGNYGGDASVFKKVIITKSGSAGLPITFHAVGTVYTQGFLVSGDYITINGFDVEDPHE